MEVDDLRDLGLDDSDNSDDITAAEILKSMENVWLNEKLAPEILPYKMELVDCLHSQIEQMDKNILPLARSDVRRSAHELELKRIKFLLTSYIRVRLFKIETYAQDIMQQEESRRNNNQEPYLSNLETEFLLSYMNITDKYMNDMLHCIPGYVQKEFKKQSVKPNLRSFVFFQSNITANGVVVDPDNIQDDIVDIQKDSKMIMPYNSVRIMLKNDEIQLI